MCTLFLSIRANDEINIEGMNQDQSKPGLNCANQIHLNIFELRRAEKKVFQK